MAEIQKICTVIDTKVHLVLNEDELCALDALFGYSVESFLEVFYKDLGRAYLEPHEAGIRSLFKTIGRCKGLASEASECREFMQQAARSKLARRA